MAAIVTVREPKRYSPVTHKANFPMQLYPFSFHWWALMISRTCMTVGKTIVLTEIKDENVVPGR